MAKSCGGWYWRLGIASFVVMGGAIAFFGNCAIAQVTPDGTLGAESSVVTPTNVNVPGEQIDGGATRGANLFHSFDEFSIPTGGEAFFNNALDIQNILSRVTGISISNIDGLIRANGTANLFLLNPNGIVFGSNARLSIGGSFIGSTASSLNFADGTQFSATAPQATPLLTVSVPIGLQYGGNEGGIQVQGSRLQVQPGKTLTLMGGDVRLDGGRYYAPGGRFELGGVAGAGTVGLNVDRNNLSLSFPNGVAQANVSLTNGAEVGVAAGGGGSITVNARNLDILGGSALNAGIARGQGSVDSQAGDITLNATGTITVAGIGARRSTAIDNDVNFRAVGKGGDINIHAGSLFLNNVFLTSSTSGQGNAGSVLIQANDSVSLENSTIFSSVGFRGVGKGGNIDIQARSISLSDLSGNRTGLTSSTSGQGDAGSISIRASDSVSVANSLITSSVYSGAVGKGGNIDIQARSISLTKTGLTSSTSGQGDAGSVLIQASDSVSLVASQIYSENLGNLSSRTGQEDIAVGRGGDINIQAGSLFLTNNSWLSTSTSGLGDAGSVLIRTSGPVSLTDSDISSAVMRRYSFRPDLVVSSPAEGKGGDINIQAQSLSLVDNAFLFSGTYGQGNAGAIFVQTNDSVSLSSDSRISSGVQAGGVGNGGDIDIQTREISLTNGSQLRSIVDGEWPDLLGGRGKGGNIRINATDSVNISGASKESSGLFTSSRPGAIGQAGNIDVTARSISLDNQGQLLAETASGQGGNITLQAPDLLLLRRNSIISTSAGTTQAGGDGGNITIDTDLLVALENSDITANAFEGRGCNIQIDAQGIFGTEFREQRTPESDITATGGSPELSGTVEINTLDVDPSQGLVELPAEVVDVSNQIAQDCPASVRSGESKFVITGRGGLPPNPNDPLTGDNILTDWNTLDSDTKNRSSAFPSTNSTIVSVPTQIVEANGWTTNDKGEVSLVATAPTATLNIPWVPKSDCNEPESES